jgi:hypothetical protein
MTQTRERTVRWLLDGDPAIRWQVMRDLTDAPAEGVAAERAQVADEGWGAELLAQQNPTGTWSDSDPGWMIAIRTLGLLKDMGADPASEPVRRAIDLVRPLRFKWHDNKLFFEGESEPCLNGRILGLGAYFDGPNESLLDRLLGEQLDDGGWNCDAPQKSHVSSFHTTICVVEGLLAYEQAKGATVRVSAARERAHEYLLERRLLRGLRSGEVIDQKFTRFGWHPNWEYDVLRALDYFRAAGARLDPRMAEAIEIVGDRQQQDGTWPLDRQGPGEIGYVTETEVGAPSRWNTLRAMRVLDWFEGSKTAA